MAEKKLKVTWKKSAIGFAQDQKDTIKPLAFASCNPRSYMKIPRQYGE